MMTFCSINCYLFVVANSADVALLVIYLVDSFAR